MGNEEGRGDAGEYSTGAPSGRFIASNNGAPEPSAVYHSIRLKPPIKAIRRVVIPKKNTRSA